MNKVESRTTKDGAFTGRIALSTADALKPLTDAVSKLEESYDRAEQRILDARRRAEKRTEDARAAKAEKELRALFDGVTERIYAEDAAKARRDDRERFERKLFGKRLPRTFRERVFGFTDEGEL
jgi:hypothetical protein